MSGFGYNAASLVVVQCAVTTVVLLWLLSLTPNGSEILLSEHTIIQPT